MSIRTKTLFAVGITIFGLLVTVSIISVRVVLDGVNKLELKRVETNTQRVSEVINVELDYLRSKTADWAHWDETYDFIVSHDPRYISTNLTKETFDILNVESLVYLDDKGVAVYAKTYDPKIKEEATASAALIEATQKILGKLLAAPLDGDVSGFIFTPEGPMYVSGRQILRSDNTGPTRGVLLFGKKFDQKEITHLASITKTKLEVDRLDEKLLPQDEQIVKELIQNKTFVTSVLSGTEVAGYFLQKDVNDKNILLIDVVQNRDFYLDGVRSVKILLIGFACSGLIFLLTVLITLEKLVLAPIIRLRGEVFEIGENSDRSKKIKTTSSRSRDEIGSLAVDINTMLQSIEEEKSYAQTYMDIVNVLMVVLARDGSIQYINSKGCDILGYSRQDLLRKNWFEMCVSEPDKVSTSNVFDRLIKGETQGTATFTNSVLAKDGKEKIFDWYNAILRNTQGVITGTVSVGRDAAERVKSDEEIRSHVVELERINQLMVGRELKMAELKQALANAEQELEKIKKGGI